MTLLPPLISEDEPPPYRFENANGTGRAFVICDHASNRLPRALEDTFGVSTEDMKKHMAWDIGAADVTSVLAQELDAPAIFSNYSRLVADVNRAASQASVALEADNAVEIPGCIPETSDGVLIPGNQNLSEAQIQQRIDTLHVPYRCAVTTHIQRAIDQGYPPLLIGLHSCTPEMKGVKRPWHVGVLWRYREDIAQNIMDNFKAKYPAAVIGENQPYSMKEALALGLTVVENVRRFDLPYAFLEVRQDLVDTPEKATKWGHILADVIKPVLSSPARMSLRKTPE